VLATVKPVCNAHGVTVSQDPTSDGMKLYLRGYGEVWEYGPWAIVPAKNDPQGHMAAATYASRGQLMQVFALAGDADDDGNEASKPAEPKQEADPIADDLATWTKQMSPTERAALKVALGVKPSATYAHVLIAWKALTAEERATIERGIEEGAA
jgi:hypothetical protein